MDWPSLITAVGGVLLTVGGGIKYMIARSDAKIEKLQSDEAAARQTVQDMMQKQIDTLTQQNTQLQRQMDRMTETVEQYREENLKLTKHVGILEGILRAKGLPVPTMEEGSNVPAAV